MPIPLDGIGLGAAGNSSTANGYTKICTIKNQGAKIPLLKVLAVKGLLSRSPLWVWAKPKVFSFFPSPTKYGGFVKKDREVLTEGTRFDIIK